MNPDGPKPGDICGDYRVINALGWGGMGAVYKVEHVITKRVEAMKVLSSDLTSVPDHVCQFLREIQVQAHLHHPNIAAVYNAFHAGDHVVMVMEFVEGESLKAQLDRGPIPLAKGVNYVCQVLRALGHAHAEGVIHRDVTPGNVIVAADGTVKLTDFGLAKTASELRAARSGAAMGSLWYMSPEQVTGNSVMDARTDIYATGAILYEVLTGKKLFDLETPFSVMRAQVEATPAPPSSRNRKVPPVFDSIVLRAVAKDPYARFQAADDFRKALEGVDLRQHRPRRSRIGVALALAGAGVAAGAGVVHVLPRLTLGESVRKAAAPKKRSNRAEKASPRAAKPLLPAAPAAATEDPPTGIRVTGEEIEEPPSPPPRRLVCPNPAKADPVPAVAPQPVPAAPPVQAEPAAPQEKPEAQNAPEKEKTNRVLRVLRDIVPGTEH